MPIVTAQLGRPLANVAVEVLHGIFDSCDIEIGGSRPYDLQLHDEHALTRVIRYGSLGLGESYMDGQWDCQRIDVLVERLLKSSQRKSLAAARTSRWLALRSRLLNLQTPRRAVAAGQYHYDIGNDLYEQMLDASMNYSCGYWSAAASLEQAQRDKMELVCRKLELSSGMSLLDIGCGWGALARYAAKHYGVRVVGVTVSKAQQRYAEERRDGLPIEIRRQDYRDIQGCFDRVVSVGMFEHVGYKNYQSFFRKCHDSLRPDGLMLLHTIGSNTSVHSTDPWLNRYIFPNGMLPSVAQIGAAIEPVFVMEDWHSFGPDYDRTLLAWHRRINSAWQQLKEAYDERFRRMWNFYLLSCAGAFRARNIQLWQIVLMKGRGRSTYHRPSIPSPSEQCPD